jgi:hypothetical protein
MTMTTTLSLALLQIVRDRRQDDAALDGALLKQTSLLATLITARREAASASYVNHAELMRLVRSQQSMLSACRGQVRLDDAGAVFTPARKAA